MEQNKEIKELTTEHLAMEVLKQEQEKSRKKNIGLYAGLIITGAVAVAAIVYGSIERSHLVDVNYQNDCEWRALFSDYDFISKDGEGINNANYGEQGDLLNGSEDKVKEKPGNQ